MSQMGKLASLNTPMETLTTDDAFVIAPVAGNIFLVGGTNIGTTGGPGAVTINLDDSISLAGTVDAGGTITSNTGDIVSILGAGSFATSVTVGNALHVLVGGMDVVGTVEFSDLVAGTMRTDAAGIVSSLADGTDGMVLISSTAGTPIWTTLTAGAGVSIVNGASSVTISSSDGVLSVTGGTNINISGTGIDPVVNLDDNVSLAGTLDVAGNITTNTGDFVSTLGAGSFATTVTAGTGVNVLTGNVDIADGNLELPNATNAPTGTIIWGVDRYIHNYGTSNFFLGKNSGNLSLTGANNLCCGVDSGPSLTTGNNNTSSGNLSLNLCEDGGANAAYGYSALGNLISGNYNAIFGAGSGTAYTSNESSNVCIKHAGIVLDANTIRIGTQGAGAGQQDKTFIAGIYGVTPAGTKNIALIDSNHQLGSVATLPVANGGTGATTFTDHGLLIGSGATAITVLAEASNGQIPIGSVGADPVLATITEGTNIDVTNGAGSITVETTKVEINDQTGTSYTLVLGDRGKLVTMTNAAASTFTIPPNSSVAFATGTVITVAQLGAGQVTLTEGSGVTISSVDSNKKIKDQYSAIALHKTGTDAWLAVGNLEA